MLPINAFAARLWRPDQWKRIDQGMIERLPGQHLMMAPLVADELTAPVEVLALS